MFRFERKSLLAILITLVLSACNNSFQAQTTPTPDPDSELAKLEYIAATQAVSKWTRNSLADFQQATGWKDFQLEFVAAGTAQNAPTEQDYQLFIIAGFPPDGWFVTPLGKDAIAVIVHPSNPIRDLDPSALGEIFTGRTQTWEDLAGRGGYIQPVIPLEGDELRAQFELSYLPGSYFLGSRLAPTPQAMLDIVAENPDAIGFVPLHALDSSVKALSIEGIRASDRSVSDGSYPLAFTILATAPEEPDGMLRSWLEWIQCESE